MKHFLSLFLVALAMHSLMATNVSFKVDMSSQPNFSPSVDSLTIAGSLNAWDSKANVLTDDNSDGIYEITLDLTAGDLIEYKYIIVDGDGDEDVWGDAVGAAAFAGTTNRAIRVPEDDLVLETVTFNACTGINSGMVSVIFQVDMSAETVGTAGVHVTGDFPGKGWWTDGFAFAESTNGVFLDTINLVPDFVLNYKYLNGNAWGTEENAIPEEVKYGDNRGGVIPDMVNQYYTLPVTPFNGKPTLYDVNFTIGSDDGKLGMVTINVFNRSLEIKQGGDTTIALADGYYPYTISAAGYYDAMDDFMVAGEVKAIDKTLASASKSLSFNIADSINVAPNSSFKITSSHTLMNADGSEITNDNVTALVTMTTGSDEVDFFAVINENKDEIMLVPNVLLASNTTYNYGIKENAIKYNDGEMMTDTMVTFTVKTYEAAMDVYQDFDGVNNTTGFYTKVADDHVGASAQPFFTGDPASSSDKALKFTKGTGSWGGWGKLQINLSAPLDLTTGKILAFDVYSAKACKVRVALTDAQNSEGGIQVETGDNAPTDVYLSKVNEWQTLYIDFSEGNFIDTVDYEHILIIFDAGVDEDNIYYVDNIKGPSLESAVSLEVAKSNDEVQIYPNPAYDRFTIAAKRQFNAVSIYDITGQLVRQYNALETQKLSIDGPSLKSGMYIIQTSGSDLNATSTLIVK